MEEIAEKLADEVIVMSKKLCSISNRLDYLSRDLVCSFMLQLLMVTLLQARPKVQILFFLC
jgi:hypothetical protein